MTYKSEGNQQTQKFNRLLSTGNFKKQIFYGYCD